MYGVSIHATSKGRDVGDILYPTGDIILSKHTKNKKKIGFIT